MNGKTTIVLAYDRDYLATEKKELLSNEMAWLTLK